MCRARAGPVSFIPGPPAGKSVPLEARQAWVNAGTTLDVPVPECKRGQFLSIDFALRSGASIDFNVMLETADGGAVRLYGPARRVWRVTTCVEIPADGVCHVIFDNFGSWFSSKLLEYSIEVGATRTHEHSASKLRYGAGVCTADRSDLADAAKEDAAVADLLKGAKTTVVDVDAGKMEEVAVECAAGARMHISFSVLSGSDVDFGVMLVPRDGGAPIRLYGPTRRSAELHTSLPVPVAGTCYLGFDASSSWVRSKQIRYAVECRADEQA